MMTKQEITELANDLIRKHLDPLTYRPFLWTFEWNTRKRAIGLCNYRNRTIHLSSFFVGKISDEEIKDTILHEIAHAIAYVQYNATGHGHTWKRVCREIGANPTRCFSGEIKKNDSDYKYKIECGACGKTGHRHRFNKSTLNQLKHGHRWFNCPNCKLKMTVTDNQGRVYSKSNDREAAHAS